MDQKWTKNRPKMAQNEPDVVDENGPDIVDKMWWWQFWEFDDRFDCICHQHHFGPTSW